MMMKQNIILIRILFLVISLNVFVPSVWAWDTASPSVPIDDPIYDTLDVLASHNLISGMIIGQRPYMRSEVARLIDMAGKRFEFLFGDGPHESNQFDPTRLNTKDQLYLKHLLIRSQERFPYKTKDELSFYEADLLEQAMFDITHFDSAPRAYYQVSGIDGFYNPLTQNSQGRHIGDGIQSSLETYHSLRISPYYSLFVHPRFQFQFYNSQGEENKAFIQELYSTVSFYNNQFDIGRKSLHWGQSRYGGMMFSNNARALDSIQLTNPTPWKIKYLGHLKYTFFVGALGPEQNYSQAMISGGKISLMPFSFLELAIARAIIFGGDGSPEASFGDIFGEFFGYRDYGNRPDMSNSISGFELRTIIPPLRNLNLYSEFYFDDFTPEHLIRTFSKDTAILVGFYLPRLDNKGSLNLRVEGRRNTTIMYKHGNWTTGWTMNNFIMGDPLGPDAESLRSELMKTFNNQLTTISHQFDFEHIDSDDFSANSEVGRFRIVDGIAEWRVRNSMGVNHQFNPYFNGHLKIGYEYVKNANFIEGNSENNFIIQFLLTMNTQGKLQIEK